MNNKTPSSPPRIELQYASKTQPPSPEPLPLDPKVKKSLWRMFYAAIGLLLILFFYSVSVSGAFGIVVFHPSIPIVIMIGSIVGSILLLSLSFRLINKRRIALGLVSLFLFLGSLPYLLFFGMMIYIGAWTRVAALTAPDATRYVLLSRVSFFGNDYALTSPKNYFLIFETYRELERVMHFESILPVGPA